MIDLDKQVAADKVSGEEVPVKKLIEDGYRIFESANGKRYLAKPNSCLFCEKCTDVFCDYTNGPYMMVCRDDRETIAGMNGLCSWFKGEEK